MEICKNLNSIKHFKNSVLTIGSFDGIHCGHLEIIKDLQAIAKKKSHPSIVVTFNPHPKFVLQKHELTNWNVLTGTDKTLEFFEKRNEKRAEIARDFDCKKCSLVLRTSSLRSNFL